MPNDVNVEVFSANFKMKGRGRSEAPDLSVELPPRWSEGQTLNAEEAAFLNREIVNSLANGKVGAFQSLGEKAIYAAFTESMTKFLGKKLKGTDPKAFPKIIAVLFDEVAAAYKQASGAGLNANETSNASAFAGRTKETQAEVNAMYVEALSAKPDLEGFADEIRQMWGNGYFPRTRNGSDVTLDDVSTSDLIAQL